MVESLREKGVWWMRGVRGRGGFWFRVREGYRIRRGGGEREGTEEGTTGDEDAGSGEEGAG